MKVLGREQKGKKAGCEGRKPMSRRGKVLLWCGAAVLLAVAVAGIKAWSVVSQTYGGERAVRVYIPQGADADYVYKVLADSLGDYGEDVGQVLRWRGGVAGRAAGSYVVAKGDRVWSVANRIRAGVQTPVKLTFNNIRTLGDLAARISSKMSWDSAAFCAACAEVLPAMGYDVPGQYIAAFVPDTYEAFWTYTPEKVVKMLASVRDKFWTIERLAKAKSLGLTTVQVATLASIVEEETAKTDERPKVARLYLNRLAINMPLQADPTVKFAIGDPTLRRITGPMLRVESPYNTYLNKGLPPGPIRMPERATMDAVLDAPEHGYLYMCARSDFSGYHDFASDYAVHKANAARYRAALDARGIK